MTWTESLKNLICQNAHKKELENISTLVIIKDNESVIKMFTQRKLQGQMVLQVYSCKHLGKITPKVLQLQYLIMETFEFATLA